jgi:intracellular multiplication protein IcmC
VAWSSPVLATRSSKKTQKKYGRFIAIIASLWLLSTNNAYALDMMVALRNLRELVIPLTQMMLAFSFAAGVYMIWRAITMLKKFGMMNSMQSQPGEFTGPIAYLVVGSILIWIPTTSDLLTSTIFGSSAPELFGQNTFDYSALGSGSQLLTYVSTSSLQALWSSIADTLVLYIQFIGFIAFIRGWMIISKASQSGAQPGSMGKGVTHIIGGIIAINFVQFIYLIQATLGM